jgi:hypothetical protein
MEHRQKRNLPLAETFYSPEGLEYRGFKLQVCVLNGTFLERKNFGTLQFCYRQFSLLSLVYVFWEGFTWHRSFGNTRCLECTRGAPKCHTYSARSTFHYQFKPPVTTDELHVYRYVLWSPKRNARY